MSTLRKLISNVRSMNRLLSTDTMVSDRAIASDIIFNSLLLIKRETNLRKLWATDTLFTTIPCLEMVEVPISDCAAYADPLTIARSKNKMPKIAEGTYNYVIQGVYSINVLGGTGKKLKEITINRYLNLLKLPAKKNEEYFWINDDYLYVTSSFVERVRITALFENGVPNDIMYPAEGCTGGEVSLDDYCMNPLDRPFYLPGYLEKQALQLTNQTLRNSYFLIPEDTASEGIDGQSGSATNIGSRRRGETKR